MDFFKSLFGWQKDKPQPDEPEVLPAPAPAPVEAEAPAARALPDRAAPEAPPVEQAAPVEAAALEAPLVDAVEAPPLPAEPPAERSLPDRVQPVAAPAAPEPPAERLKLVSQSLLENEALTADLDDQAAEVALNWALDCARRIVADTAGLDDAAAEQAMYPRLKALRRMLKAAARWVAARPSPEALVENLPGVLEQAALVYGVTLAPAARPPALFQAAEDAAGALSKLRGLVESLFVAHSRSQDAA